MVGSGRTRQVMRVRLLMTAAALALWISADSIAVQAADGSPAPTVECAPDSTLVTARSDDSKPARNPALERLPAGQWTRIHVQHPGDAVTFARQRHGGATFDSRRGRVVLFGSDTHGDDWTNSPLFFHMETLTWSRAYADDDPATYRVDVNGIPVAGPSGDHPWAMHTFGAVDYDRQHDAIIVASLPDHLEPGRFTDAMHHVWPAIRRHPSWLFHLKTNRWCALPSPPVRFFANATAYDHHRGVLIGYRRGGVFELGGDPLHWQRVKGEGFLAWHLNAVYDSSHRALVVFGDHRLRNDVVVYHPASGRHAVMPTLGVRPPPAQHAPMAFHERLGRTVVVVDRPPEASGDVMAETWLYDLGADAWSRVEGADLSFAAGMNYAMVYDPLHDLVVLVAGADPARPEVWVLRL